MRKEQNNLLVDDINKAYGTAKNTAIDVVSTVLTQSGTWAYHIVMFALLWGMTYACFVGEEAMLVSWPWMLLVTPVLYFVVVGIMAQNTYKKQRLVKIQQARKIKKATDEIEGFER